MSRLNNELTRTEILAKTPTLKELFYRWPIDAANALSQIGALCEEFGNPQMQVGEEIKCALEVGLSVYDPEIVLFPQKMAVSDVILEIMNRKIDGSAKLNLDLWVRMMGFVIVLVALVWHRINSSNCEARDYEKALEKFLVKFNDDFEKKPSPMVSAEAVRDASFELQNQFRAGEREAKILAAELNRIAQGINTFGDEGHSFRLAVNRTSLQIAMTRTIFTNGEVDYDPFNDHTFLECVVPFLRTVTNSEVQSKRVIVALQEANIDKSLAVPQLKVALKNTFDKAWNSWN